MSFKSQRCALVSAILLAFTVPAMAQSNSAIDELKRELERLRQEVNQLKGNSAAPAATTEKVNTRLEQVELRQKDSVTAGDVPGSFRLPGSNNWDISLFKNFSLFKEGKVRMQYRLEMYNAFNHTQFTGVDTTARFDANNNQVNALFGSYTAAANSRRIVMGLKLNF